MEALVPLVLQRLACLPPPLDFEVVCVPSTRKLIGPSESRTQLIKELTYIWNNNFWVVQRRPLAKQPKTANPFNHLRLGPLGLNKSNSDGPGCWGWGRSLPRRQRCSHFPNVLYGWWAHKPHSEGFSQKKKKKVQSCWDKTTSLYYVLPAFPSFITQVMDIGQALVLRSPCSSLLYWFVNDFLYIFLLL